MRLRSFRGISRFRERLLWVSAILLSTCLTAAIALVAETLSPPRKHRREPVPRGASAGTIDFNRDIAPIFQASCNACHTGDKAQAHLRLDSEAAVFQGGISGKGVIPGNNSQSLLVERLVGATRGPRMPVGADPLSPAQITTIRAWIDQLSPSVAADNSQIAPQPQAVHTPGAATASTANASQQDNYAAKIQPIFATHCVKCHGPDVQQNQLRLDSLAFALKGGLSRKVIIPGNSKDSPLVRRLLGLDEPRMPFKGESLPSDQIALIRAWIDAGAQGSESAATSQAKPQKHWAYIKPERPPIPAVKNTAWVRNPIDNFVLARLEKEALSPSPEADRETLIRRVSLDLIGLPPTPKEMDAFVADKSPNAYEKVVDRLLASPHYGERWARPWLDLARYADSNGYEKDDHRSIWKYRDWVINAMNQDLSFREFTIEQIAGDMLPNATNEQKMATGFHRNTLLNQEGGVDQEEARWETLVDRVNTTATVWLGSTLACAQCHNHKYDPFSQKDYYRFLAFFDNADYRILKLGQGEGWVQEPQLELPTPEQEAKSKELKAEIAKIQTELNTSTPELEAAQAKWENEMKAAETEWAVLRPTRFFSEHGATLGLMDDISILAGGRNPDADTYVVESTIHRLGITGLRIEVLKHPSLARGGPGRDPDGNFFLSDFEVEAAPADKSSPSQKIVIKDASADESQRGYDIKNLFNDKPKPKGWAVELSDANAPLRRQAIFIPEKPFGFDHGTTLTIRLKHQMAYSTRNIGRFRLSVSSAANPERIASVPARLRPVLDIPVAQRTTEQKNELASLYRSLSPLLQPTRDRIAELQKSLDKLGIATTMIMGERQSFEHPSTYLRVRGSYLSKGDKVYAGVPAVLPPLPENQLPNRLGLAHWLVDEENPLTARVTVNRFWEQYFGRGIVQTSEDLGTQGERPTYPELLDWLATEFMRQGWSMKAIHRLTVSSATYRQSSRVTPELVERDPYNKLLARGPRFRVEAEMARDIALAASGLLSPKIGGPSVFPYQPEGIWDRPYSNHRWQTSEGEDRYRRGIYTFIRRTSPYPSLTTFDAPSREFCTVRRVRTNTPLQALTTLNDPVFFEAARALAKRIMVEAGPDPSQRTTYGFRLCVSRHPDRKELEELVSFRDQQLERFRKDEKAASEVVKGVTNPPSDIADLASWTMVSNVLLNLDETITKE